MIRVVIADDHRSVRESLRLLLGTEPGFMLVGEAEDGDGAIRLAHALRPDVLLTDLNMPGPDGFEVAATLRKQTPRVRVLILTLDDSPSLARHALDVGAAGLASKLLGPSELLMALAVVASGETYVGRRERVRSGAGADQAAGRDRRSDETDRRTNRPDHEDGERGLVPVERRNERSAQRYGPGPMPRQR